MTTLQKYNDPKKRIKYVDDYVKKNYKTLHIKLHKINDKEIVEYFDNADNKVEALRKLFK